MLKKQKGFLIYNNMIKEKELNINIVSRNLKYYNDLGYACHSGEKISINITDIPKKSHIKVTAICDHCGKETTISNQKYNENFEKYNLYTCKKCCQIKIKLTNNEKYGVDYPLQNVNIYNKLKETNIYKYGVENVFQNIEIKNKIHERIWKDAEMIKKYPQWCCRNALLFKDKSLMKLALDVNQALDKIWINKSKEYVNNIKKCLPVKQRSKEYIEHIADHMNISNYTRIEKWELAKEMILKKLKNLDIFIETIALYSSENEIVWSYSMN